MHDCRPLVRAAMLALCCSSAAMAHQSLTGEFNSASHLELRGASTDVEWSNLDLLSALPASTYFTHFSFTYSITFEDVIPALTRSGL